ncbi:hypothetical protein NLG97_g4547 [Lecanicillium saksenae]|uniref:Uncharacterized protein n=1 Tax=Lecanicillium saksenae TaxID=468837 RepID=A0ACC1QV54_9HYPO|nr:hypothetical protein NLG97_g4547 [Lecanicillium saksenae]
MATMEKTNGVQNGTAHADLAKPQSQDLASFVEQIQHETKTIVNFCNENTLPLMSFSQDFPVDLAEPIQASRARLREAARAVYDITTGPFDHLFSIAWGLHDIATLRWILHFKIPEAIPLAGNISYDDLALKCEVSMTSLRRMLRFCMVKRLFQEPMPEQVAHSSFSSLLVTDTVLRGQLEYLCEDSFPISTRLVEAHEKWPGSTSSNNAAFNLARNTDLQRYAYLAQPGNEEQLRRFHNMLTFARKERATDVKYVPRAYSWDKVNTVVDIGGGSGGVAVTLARAFPHICVIVEDQAESVAAGAKSLPPELQDRVRLVERDFFAERLDEQDAAKKTYFLRLVLHNWPDKDVRRIIERLVPGMQAGAKLLVMDMMVPAPGTVPPAMEWWMRSLDMEMMLGFNSKVRSQQDWSELFMNIGPGLEMKSNSTPDGSGLTIMEFGLAK